MKMSKVFADFKRINTQCELRRTLEFIIGKTTYRVEVLYCYSNPKSPWSAQAYSESHNAWKCVSNFPWVGERNEEARDSGRLELSGRPWSETSSSVVGITSRLHPPSSRFLADKKRKVARTPAYVN